jgi:hypothetical protein
MPDGPSGENTGINKTGYRAFFTSNLSYKPCRKINHSSKFFPPKKVIPQSKLKNYWWPIAPFRIIGDATSVELTEGATPGMREMRSFERVKKWWMKCHRTLKL